MSNCPVCCIFMAITSVKIQEKLRILMDQNAKDMAQYIKERRGLERGISHYCNFKAFLDIKTIVRMNQEIDHSQGDYKVHAFNTR